MIRIFFLVFVIGIVIYLMLNQSCMVEGMEDDRECTEINCNAHCMMLPTACTCDENCDDEDPECGFDGIPKCRRRTCENSLREICSNDNGVDNFIDCVKCYSKNEETLSKLGANCSIRGDNRPVANACENMFPINYEDRELKT